MRRPRTLLRTLTVVLTLFLGGGVLAQAQFGIKKPKLPKIERNSGNSNSGSSEEKEQISDADDHSDDLHKMNNGISALVYSAAFPPSLLYSTVLKHEGMMFFKDGRLRLGNITAVFLPEKDESGTSVSYGFNKKDHRLTSILYDENNSEVGTTYWLAPANSVFGQEGAFRTIQSTSNQGENEFAVDKGDYRLDFFLDGKQFYSLPFSVSVISEGDPYDPKPVYGINGPWQDYGYMYISDARSDRNVSWKMWLRNDSPDPVISKQDVTVTVKLKRNGKQVAATRDAMHSTVTRQWNRFEFMLVDEKNTSQVALTGADIFNNSGSYELSVDVDKEKGGDVFDATYEFEVKDGKIQHGGRQAREGTDPLRYLEGGRDAWWFQKKGGKYE